jgi:hypothetical protein
MESLSYPTKTSAAVQWDTASHEQVDMANVSYPTKTSTVQWYQRGIMSHVSKYTSNHGKCQLSN